MATWVWVVIVIAVVVVVALVAVGARRRRTAMLRGHFGPEYDRAVENRRTGAQPRRTFAHVRSSVLSSLKPLPEATRLSFASEWRDLQERRRPAGASHRCC